MRKLIHEIENVTESLLEWVVHDEVFLGIELCVADAPNICAEID